MILDGLGWLQRLILDGMGRRKPEIKETLALDSPIVLQAFLDSMVCTNTDLSSTITPLVELASPIGLTSAHDSIINKQLDLMSTI